MNLEAISASLAATREGLDAGHFSLDVAERDGHLLLTGSVAGRRALPGSLYSATKFAVTGMAESVRQELNGSGVRVTLISPGQTDTPFFDDRIEWRRRPTTRPPRPSPAQRQRICHGPPIGGPFCVCVRTGRGDVSAAAYSARPPEMQRSRP